MEKRVLIIDDEPDICDFLSEYFASKGFTADFALNGKSALEKINTEPPDIVLLDVRMPEMGGLEVLEKIKEFDPEIGVIMVTGVNDEDIGRLALERGASDFVMKPIDLEYLEQSILAKLLTIKS